MSVRRHRIYVNLLERRHLIISVNMLGPHHLSVNMLGPHHLIISVNMLDQCHPGVIIHGQCHRNEIMRGQCHQAGHCHQAGQCHQAGITQAAYTRYPAGSQGHTPTSAGQCLTLVTTQHWTTAW